MPRRATVIERARTHEARYCTLAHVDAFEPRLGESLRRARRRGQLSIDDLDWLGVRHFPFDRRAIAWEEGYRRLTAYVESLGRSNVPVRHQCEDGFRLGQWLAVQRRQARRNRLSAERLQRLAAVGVALPGGSDV